MLSLSWRDTVTNEEDVARVGAVESSAERAEREADELPRPCDKE